MKLEDFTELVIKLYLEDENYVIAANIYDTKDSERSTSVKLQSLKDIHQMTDFTKIESPTDMDNYYVKLTDILIDY